VVTFRVSKSIRVNAPIERAFAYISDWRNATKVQASFSSFEPMNSAEVGEGTILAVKGKFHSLPINVRMKIIEFEPPVRMVGIVSGMLKSVNAWLFEPTDDGRTKVTFVNEYDIPAPLTLLLGKSSFIDREINTMTEDSLRRLKQQLENSDQ
jgi:carbon monoxide dehydrogenase subunit G